MIMTSINKVKLASINDKRHYGSDGIVSLPFGHHLLNEITYCKLNKKNTLEIKSLEQTTTRDYMLNSKFL